MGGSGCSWIWRLVLILQLVGGIHYWGKEGHYATCKIAEEYLSEDAKASVRELLPSSSQGDLASLCSWAEEIRFHYHWSGALHYSTLLILPASVYRSQKEVLPVLLDQPLHVAFTGDEGGNTIIVHWYRRKSIPHHVWDIMIIETLKTFYGNDLLYMIKSIVGILRMSGPMICQTGGIANPIKQHVLTHEYFLSRLPIVEKRLAQGGVQLATTLNRICSSQKNLAQA